MKRPRVLCVDDEPQVLEGLQLILRRHFEVVTATSGVAGLVALKSGEPFCAVVSDMRMPVMSGAVFLKRAKEEVPDTTRILLTGQADLEAAMTAVNDGQIFRFLMKPCPPESLLKAVQAAVDQHRLVTSERVLLEQTLHGSIKILMETLALSNPAAYGRALSLKGLVGELGRELGHPDVWQAEMAVMLSQASLMTLPPDTLQRLQRQEALGPEEEQLVRRLPEIADRLLGHIPRLEAIRAIILHQDHLFEKAPEGLPWGARAFKLAADYHALESLNLTTKQAIEDLEAKQGYYDPLMIRALETVLQRRLGARIQELFLDQLREGMTFAEEVLALKNGNILVAEGQQATASLLLRLGNARETFGFKEPFRIILPPANSDEADMVREETKV